MTTSSAQDERRFIDLSQVPVEDASPTDFVPRGWVIEKQVSGDLNEDSRPDVVLELIEDLPPLAGGEPHDRYRAMLVLMGEGKLHRVAAADRLLRCSTCFGALAGPNGGEPDIKIARGVIIVNHLWGSRESVDSTQRFRYDPQLRRFVLIGEDIENRDRDNGTGTHESSNYLTGVKIVEKYRYDERLDHDVQVSTSRQRVPKIRRFLEDIDYEKY
jgi:hypothetical protein